MNDAEYQACINTLVERLKGPLLEDSSEARLLRAIFERYKEEINIHVASAMHRYHDELATRAAAKEEARTAKVLAEHWDYGTGNKGKPCVVLKVPGRN